MVRAIKYKRKVQGFDENRPEYVEEIYIYSAGFIDQGLHIDDRGCVRKVYEMDVNLRGTDTLEHIDIEVSEHQFSAFMEYLEAKKLYDEFISVLTNYEYERLNMYGVIEGLFRKKVHRNIKNDVWMPVKCKNYKSIDHIDRQARVIE